jgi:xylose dehydrogenase (NAD/NADP)
MEKDMPISGGKVRWGILGVAKINERLVPAFRGAANAELRAIASRSLEKAQAAAARDGIPIAYSSYEQLLDDAKIDAIYNPLPNSLHAEWTMKAAERGKHVLCEKPLASDAVEAERVVDFCRQRQVRLMEGFMWPHHPRTHRLRELLNSGGIGQVRRVTGAFTFLLDLEPNNIRLQPDLAGGSVMDVGCYPVYGARWVFGAEPTRVYATAEWQHGVDVGMNGLLEFSDGRTAHFDCGFTLPFRGHLEIVGSEGTVRLPEMWLPSRRAVFEVLRENRPAAEVAVEGEDQIVHMIQNFSQAVLDGREPAPGPEQAIATLRVLDALRLSAKERRPVALPVRTQQSVAATLPSDE